MSRQQGAALKITHDQLLEFAKEQTVTKAREFFGLVFIGPLPPWVLAMPAAVRAALADVGESLHGANDHRVRLLRRT